MKIIKKILKIGSKEKIKNILELRERLLKSIAEKDEIATLFVFSQLSERKRRLVLNPKVDYLTTSYTEDPLHFAIRNRLAKCVELFVPYINDINRQPYAVGTALHIACQQGMKHIVELLLTRKDINLNAKNYHFGTSSFGGDLSHATPLHLLVDYIAKFGDLDGLRMDIIKLLLNDKRINVHAKNVHGQSIIEKAKKTHAKDNKIQKKLVEALSQESLNLRAPTANVTYVVKT